MPIFSRRGICFFTLPSIATPVPATATEIEPQDRARRGSKQPRLRNFPPPALSLSIEEKALGRGHETAKRNELYKCEKGVFNAH